MSVGAPDRVGMRLRVFLVAFVPVLVGSLVALERWGR